jgi:hypothetical protein
MNSPEAIITQAWIHSHEEDSGDELVFRPAAYSFPPSRGRTGYDLRSNGTLRLTGPSPEDRQSSSDGTWQLTEPGELVLNVAGQGVRRYVITSLSKDKLVLKRTN